MARIHVKNYPEPHVRAEGGSEPEAETHTGPHAPSRASWEALTREGDPFIYFGTRVTSCGPALKWQRCSKSSVLGDAFSVLAYAPRWCPCSVRGMWGSHCAPSRPGLRPQCVRISLLRVPVGMVGGRPADSTAPSGPMQAVPRGNGTGRRPVCLLSQKPNRPRDRENNGDEDLPVAFTSETHATPSPATHR